ncbi:MAG TPA: anthranilate phosphoribosyltransferase [Rhizomicrobium sp.]|nr:anthranilate phosphoribosyltransferase [Rhizomicrobium sp.]
MSRTEAFTPYLDEVRGGQSLDADAASSAFEAIMTGGVAEADLAAFLIALADRGPTVAEILGAARVMRAKMRTIEAPPGAVDLCGTGGDGQGTLNVSTAVSFVVAACGVPVAKHGNRNMSSRTGAADVLEALGARIDLPPEAAQACLRETGLCFLFAQAYHPAMRHVAEVRRKLGRRTIFNLLGPLSNPARVGRQLIGVFAKEWLRPVAEVLSALGSERVWAVHGADGLDEIAIAGATFAAILDGGRISRRTIVPEDAGLACLASAAIEGGTPEENAAALRHLLDGARGAYRDIVLINAAAVLCIADKAKDLREGAALAAHAVDGGAAKKALERFVAFTRAAA